jgi:hypothetical protein
MGITVYINEPNRKARVHEDGCSRIRQQGGGGTHGSYRYFDCYEEAWEYLNDNYDDYDCDDCSYCDPENESCE